MSRLATLLALLATGAASAWDPGRLAIPVVIDERPIPYPVFAIYLMPGQSFDAHFIDATQGGEIRFGGETGKVGEMALKAPGEPGLTRLEIENAASGELAVINVFTMTPASRVDPGGYLDGYRIGAYPKTPLRGLDIYLPPTGFVEVTADNADTELSPNFRLGQFVAKQAGGYPKYVVLRAGLLLKLENILATLNERGHPTDGFVIMSGYRTPYYNRAIGNVPYSRHVYGGAADIYIDDSPRDGRMDDVNGDGVVNRKDARWLANFINEMSREGEFGPRVGGLGVYGSNAAHGPFVHVDVRGTLARW